MSALPEARASYMPAGSPGPGGALDWQRIAAELDAHGCAVLKHVLTAEDCKALVRSYPEDGLFRSRVVMARHGFGRGEYKYFSYPLPPVVAKLRATLFPPLAAIANRWNESLGTSVRYPTDHAAYLERCQPCPHPGHCRTRRQRNRRQRPRR